ncbi:MAG: hypothetical protein HYZ15_02005 [Sphingobacteriales bacterium]|nr:hypothetical protein [Sphingobacteriales bacterium]
MKRKLLLSVIFISLLPDGYSQAPADLLQQWYQRAPVEKTWLHFDRDNYLAGETAWFKAYLYSDYQPDTISSVLYVELLNEASVILSRKALPVMLASTYGQFELPDTLVTGMYLVRAYTPTMLNNGIEYVYKKKLFIFGKKPIGAEPPNRAHTVLLDFFPEGGNLVSGFTNTIAFKATDEKGQPVEIKGTINNSKGQEVTTFSSYHDGMGMFELIPESGEKYTARLGETASPQTYPLPVIADKGLVLSIIPHPQGGFFEIHQRMDNPSRRAAYMIGQMQHHVLFRQDLSPAKDEMQGVLNTEKLNSGIMQVTVFTGEGLPLAERLFFVNNKEYIHTAALRTDTLSFAEKGRNHFTIQLKDTVQGSLSLSVTDADYALSPQRPENIYSGLLLTADLRGYIHNPAWYFSAEDDSVKTATDLLMMTHGWRRFRWEELASKLKQPLPFADPSYITITGRVTLGGTNRSFPEKTLIALISAEGMRRNAQFITTDMQGNFKLDSLLFFGDARIFIVDIRGKKSKYIDVKMTSDTLGRSYPVVYPGHSFFAESSLAGKQKKLADDFEAIQKANGLMLEEITLKVKKKNPTDLLDEQYTRGAFSGPSERSIDLVNTEEFVTGANIFDYLQLRIPGLDLATDGNEYKLYYRQGPMISSMGPIPMTLYLNEIETDASVIASLPPSEIALVKLYSTFIGATGGGAGGAMAIYTRKGADITNSSRGDLISYRGFSVVKEFYVPDYKADPSLLVKPDTRITLDWRPNIFVNNINPVIPVSFYNTDRTRKFRVVVEGMTTSGKLISLEKIISQ